MVVGLSDLCGVMTPGQREIEQVRLIEVYLRELWCPERPMFGPALPPPVIEKPHAHSYWLRHLDHAWLRTLPYADVLEAIRAA
jgi:hypothetical protein